MDRLRYQRDVDSLKPKAERYEVYFESPTGLGVRVSPKSGRYPEGRKVYFLFYRTKAGRFRRYTLGDVPNWKLSDLKAKAALLKGEIAKGNDPQGTKIEAREAERERAAQRRRGIPDSRRLSKAIDSYVGDPKVASKKAVAQKAAHLRRDLLGLDREGKIGSDLLGDADVRSITKADIERCLRAKTDQGKHVVANRVLAHARTFFRWLSDKGMIDSDPTAGIAKPLTEEKVRNRFLELAEIPVFWKACEKVPAPYGQLFRFALLTAARRTECGQMEWSEIDWGDKVWILPASKTKGGRDHVLPLSTVAQEIVQGQPRVEGSPYVFARADGGTPNAWSAATEALNTACGFKRMKDEDAPGSWLSPHDLRRSCTEGLDRLGVDPHIVDSILNHSQGKLKRAYRRWQYVDEKRAALEAWAERVGNLLRTQR